MLGVLFARWGLYLLVAFGGGNLPRTSEIGLNFGILGFTLIVALITGLIFGFVPAMLSSRNDLSHALKEGGKGATFGKQQRYTFNLLVIAEVTLAVVLLIGAGLLVNSFIRVQNVRSGFDEKNVLAARLDLPNPYAQPEKKQRFFEQLQQQVSALPGVEAVGLVSELPLARQSADLPFKVRAKENRGDQSEVGHADIRNINHDYFRAMHIPLLRGREHSTDSNSW